MVIQLATRCDSAGENGGDLYQSASKAVEDGLYAGPSQSELTSTSTSPPNHSLCTTEHQNSSTPSSTSLFMSGSPSSTDFSREPNFSATPGRITALRQMTRSSDSSHRHSLHFPFSPSNSSHLHHEESGHYSSTPNRRRYSSFFGGNNCNNVHGRSGVEGASAGLSATGEVVKRRWAYTIINQPTSDMITVFSFGRTMLLEQELLDFIHKPVPQNFRVQCRIVRRKEGFERFSPSYELYLEEGESTKLFLLSAKRRKKKQSSYYLITTQRDPSHCKGKMSDGIVGKLESNFLGTSFVIYSNGRNPFKAAVSREEEKIPIREELGVITYDPNLLGFNGPRKMTVILGTMTRDGKRPECRPTKESSTMLARYRRNETSNLLVLHNKSPQWNEDTQSYVLNFHGRVTLASVKNFQIVHDNDPDYIIMQFGRIDDDLFNMDFQYPLSPLQAFAIALSSFDGKLACE
ncbi:uncharacterized protein VTP21DRAFT_3289 [Calcarisporiella thermophila]|uniref:uncharacterized protein n=1 Tax=Calcarisporiella thermophila TaxID=911321 RepID=UPI003743CE14